ncbi:MAG: Fur family transcriptional regulator [Lachnospirales bacterium]
MENILIDNLRRAKLKITPQRMAIYSYLMSATNHPSAETIYKDLKPDYPSMSLATVYKNIATLRDAHLVTEFNVGEDSHRYDADTEFHTHLVCRECHNVFDYFGDIPLDDVVMNLRDNMGFHVEEKELIFYGTCKKCFDNKHKH